MKSVKISFRILSKYLFPFMIWACTDQNYDSEILNSDADNISVVMAVQLGAEPGCKGISEILSGNVGMIKIAERADIALLINDGSPLCVDTIEEIVSEINDFEEKLIQENNSEQRFFDNTDGNYGDEMRNELRNSQEIKETSGESESEPRKFDPDPQPATKTMGNSIAANSATGSSGIVKGGTNPSGTNTSSQSVTPNSEMN